MKKSLKRCILGVSLGLLAMNALADLSEGLVAYYPFDGDAQDASGNGNHGTVYWATLTTDRFGKAEGAYNFDGVTHYVEIQNDASLQVEHLSLSAWVYRAGDCAECMIFNKEYSYELAIIGEVLQWAISIEGWGSWAWHNTGATIPRDQWVHVGVTFDGATVKSYVNDELVDEQPYVGLTAKTETVARIGARSKDGISAVFNGTIDEVRLYNRPLTDAEIQALYQAGPCDHATYSITDNRLTIPFIDIPLLNPDTHQPSGEVAVFRGELLAGQLPSEDAQEPCGSLGSCYLDELSSEEQLTLVPSCLKYVIGTRIAGDPCHAVYSFEDKTLKIPFLNVSSVTWPTFEESLPIRIFEVTLKHRQLVPLGMGVLQLADYNLLYSVE